MREWIRALRPEQWTKNVFVLAALVFSMRFLEAGAFARALVAFAVFCAASSAAYLVNDVVDVERDRAHPDKCRRPLAAGLILPRAALGVAAVLASGALVVAVPLGAGVLATVAAYLALQAGYTLWFKRIVIADVVAVATGFVLRTVAGVAAVGAHMSKWLFVSTFLLALFLALAKRRHELVVLGSSHGDHRDVLGRYEEMPLDGMLVVLAAATFGVYVQYTLSPAVAARLGTDFLYLTLPFVVLGLFRYLYLIYRRDLAGNPTSALLTDRPLQASVALWAATVLFLLYA